MAIRLTCHSKATGTASGKLAKRVSAAGLTASLLIGCLSASASPGSVSTGTPSFAATPDPNAITVVTTTSVFADLIQNVGAGHVRATSLVPSGGDVHTFEPKPADVRLVASARLLVMNGLGLDDWLEGTITSANAAAPLVKLGVGLPGVELLPGEQPGTQNPHLWMDVKNAELYVERVAAALKQVDAANAADYAASLAAYKANLDSLDRWVREQVATIPEANRRIVTFHPALPYFARAYGITVVGVAVQAPGQDPSAGAIAALIQAIRSTGVKAIFSENQFPPKLVDQLAHETGTTVVAELYDDSLGAPPISSYDAVIRWDVRQLVDALR